LQWDIPVPCHVVVLQCSSVAVRYSRTLSRRCTAVFVCCSDIFPYLVMSLYCSVRLLQWDIPVPCHVVVLQCLCVAVRYSRTLSCHCTAVFVCCSEIFPYLVTSLYCSVRLLQWDIPVPCHVVVLQCSSVAVRYSRTLSCRCTAVFVCCSEIFPYLVMSLYCSVRLLQWDIPVSCHCHRSGERSCRDQVRCQHASSFRGETSCCARSVYNWLDILYEWNISGTFSNSISLDLLHYWTFPFLAVLDPLCRTHNIVYRVDQ